MIREWLQQRRDIKAAHEMARLIDTGEMELHVVGLTPSGKEIMVPTPLLAQWNAMSPEAREEALAAMDQTYDV